MRTRRGMTCSPLAASGDIVRFVDGSEFRITKSAADTNGEYLQMEWFLPPSTETPPKHIHPRQREEYEVLDGVFEVFVRDAWRTVRAGESASAPAGEVHTFRVGDQPVGVRNVHAPALDFEDYFAAESARSSRLVRFRPLPRPHTRGRRNDQWVGRALGPSDKRRLPGGRRAVSVSRSTTSERRPWRA